MLANRKTGLCGLAIVAFLAVVLMLMFGAAPHAFAEDDTAGEQAAAEGAEQDSAQEAAKPSAVNVEPPKSNVDVGDGNLVDPSQRADNSFIYDTTIESLFDESSLYEGRTVQVVGEAIGDLIYANDGEGNCWVTLTSTDVDNPSSISVLMSEDQARQIDHFGRYGTTGTKLQVRGVYHQACAEHDGLPDIHATNSAVIARGTDHPDDFRSSDYLVGAILVLIGAGLLALYYFVRERAR